MFKKLLLMVVLLLMTFNVCYATEYIDYDNIIFELDNRTGGIVLEEIEVEEKGFLVQSFSASTVLTVEEYIRQQLFNHTEIIDLRIYKITLAELSMILATNKDFVVASGYIDYDYIRGTSVPVKDRIVTYYQPNYLFETKAEDALARKLIDDSISQYVEEINSKTDDKLGKLLLLHDELIEDCEYDDEYKIRSFSLHSVFANKEMVCQGYAQAMYFIGRELGIEVDFCSSFEIGHIWNYVELDDKYYHIDSTWNDPVLIMQSDSGDKRVHRTTALHKNFLMSDETMQSEGTDHGSKNDWITSMDTIPVCNSKKYENNHFFNIPTAFTTSINNGNYEATVYIQTYSGTQENKVFYADGLYTGPIITSYPEETDTSYFVYCLITANTNKFNIYVKTHKSGKVIDIIRYEKNGYSKNSLTGQEILKSDLKHSNEQILVYMWDVETMKPLSRVIPIEVPTGEIETN